MTMGNLKSRRIAYDASDAVFLAALEQDLGLTVRKLDAQEDHVSIGRTWYVTFGAIAEDYDIPPIFMDDTGLTGNNARGWTHVAMEGHGPMTGFFRLKFRESNWTQPLIYNASANDVQQALESLPTIDQVSVRRQGPDANRG